MTNALVRGDFHLPLLSFDGFDELFREFLPSWEHNLKCESFPKVAQNITDNELTYQLALAGYPEDKLKVEAGDGYLIIKGEKLEDTENLHAGRAFTWSRRDPGGTWDFQKSEVSYKHGMLTIKVPKKEEAKPKALEIKIK